MDKILVIDDDDNARKNIIRSLKIYAYNIFSAAKLKEALELINEHYFKVIITDMVMEDDRAGLSVLMAAKKKETSTRVLIITAYGKDQDAKKMEDEGAFAYIEKNANDSYETLSQMVREAIVK